MTSTSMHEIISSNPVLILHTQKKKNRFLILTHYGHYGQTIRLITSTSMHKIVGANLSANI